MRGAVPTTSHPAPLVGGNGVERFWSKVDKSGGPDACWPWLAYVLPRGYGQYADGRRLVLAHRFSYAQHIGPIPDGLELNHTCHNIARALGECVGGDSCMHRRCFNPAHLEPVTA